MSNQSGIPSKAASKTGCSPLVLAMLLGSAAGPLVAGNVSIDGLSLTGNTCILNESGGTVFTGDFTLIGATTFNIGSVNYLVVGGGGGGGGAYPNIANGGGGGGGQVRIGSVRPGPSAAVMVGGGGAAGAGSGFGGSSGSGSALGGLVTAQGGAGGVTQTGGGGGADGTMWGPDGFAPLGYGGGGSTGGGWGVTGASPGQGIYGNGTGGWINNWNAYPGVDGKGGGGGGGQRGATDGSYLPPARGGSGVVVVEYLGATGAVGGGTVSTGSTNNAFVKATFAANGTLTIQDTQTSTFSGNISGSGSLILTGGTAILTGSNTYSGSTIVNTGTLVLAATPSLPAATKLLIQHGGKVSLADGVNPTIQHLSLGGQAAGPGTYGSTSSAATYKDDNYFTGTGMVSNTATGGEVSQIFHWNPAQASGPSDGSGTWGLNAPNWWWDGQVTPWVDGGNAVIGNGGEPGTLSLGADVTAGNITFSAASNSSPTAPYGNRPIVAYMSHWAPHYLDDSARADHVFNTLTHLVYIGSASVSADGTVAIADDSGLANVVAITHARNRKILVSIVDGSGSSDWSGKMCTVAQSPALRAKLIANVLEYCRMNHLDGVDFDWEFPPPELRSSFMTFLQELRAAAPPGFLISTAVMSVYSEIAQAPIDWFYVMAYTFNPSQCDAMMSGWVAAGTPRSKLVLGLGIYGQNSSGGAMGFSDLIGSANIDPGVNSINGYSFTGGRMIRELTQYAYYNGFNIGWFRIELDTCDHRSLMLAGSTQARLAALDLGINAGYAIQRRTLTQAGTCSITANSDARINSVLAGGSLVKTGSGVLSLRNSNSYNGGTTLSSGALFATAVGSLGGGNVVINDADTGSRDTSLAVSVGVNYGQSLTIANQGSGSSMVAFIGSLGSSGVGTAPFTTITLNKAATFNFSDFGTGYYSFNSNVSGSGPLTITGRTQYNLAGGSWSSYTGDITIDRDGKFDFRGALGGSAINRVTVNGTMLVVDNQTMGPLNGDGLVSTLSGYGGGTQTLTLGNGGGDGAFTGVITQQAEQALSLVKKGAGIQDLAGSNNYSGPTYVREGTLHISGTLASPVTVESGATIRGAGVINNSLAVNSGAFITTRLPGPPLTVNGDLNLSGTLNITDTGGFSSGTYTLITYTGTLTNQRLAIGAVPNMPFVHTIDTNTPGKVKLNVALTPFAAWQVRFFGGFTHADAAANADSDKDGLANLVEYALGLDPKTPNAKTIRHDLATVGTKTYLRASVTRDPQVNDVRIEGLSAATLLDPNAWSVDSTVVESDTPDLFRVRDAEPRESHSRRFLRLRFTLQ